MRSMREIKMQSNFLVFFYLLSLIFFIPIAVLGAFLKKSRKSAPPKKKTPTPQEILENIQKSQEDLLHAKKDFEKFFLKSSSCNRETWFKLIEEFALSKWLETKEIIDFQEKIKSANPNLQKDITLTISTALKNRK